MTFFQRDIFNTHKFYLMNSVEIHGAGLKRMNFGTENMCMTKKITMRIKFCFREDEAFTEMIFFY